MNVSQTSLNMIIGVFGQVRRFTPEEKENYDREKLKEMGEKYFRKTFIEELLEKICPLVSDSQGAIISQACCQSYWSMETYFEVVRKAFEDRGIEVTYDGQGSFVFRKKTEKKEESSKLT